MITIHMIGWGMIMWLPLHEVLLVCPSIHWANRFIDMSLILFLHCVGGISSTVCSSMCPVYYQHYLWILVRFWVKLGARLEQEVHCKTSWSRYSKLSTRLHLCRLGSWGLFQKAVFTKSNPELWNGNLRVYYSWKADEHEFNKLIPQS